MKVTDLPYCAGVIDVGSNASSGCALRPDGIPIGCLEGLGILLPNVVEGRGAVLTCFTSLYSYFVAIHMNWMTLINIRTPRNSKNRSSRPKFRFFGSHPYPCGSVELVIHCTAKTSPPERYDPMQTDRSCSAIEHDRIT